MDEARGVVAAVSSEFTSHFGREKVGALELTGDRDADTALVATGTIGDSAQELVEGDDDLLVVRVHTYRPFPAEELSAALSGASYVCVVDRAAAFGSLGPLGADVKSLDLEPHAVTNVVCGLGGADVTPVTLRFALDRARSDGASLGPVYVTEEVS
jgi:pyruvate ferredoxin oxidoreductase alpha subunit